PARGSGLLAAAAVSPHQGGGAQVAGLRLAVTCDLPPACQALSIRSKRIAALVWDTEARPSEGFYENSTISQRVLVCTYPDGCASAGRQSRFRPEERSPAASDSGPDAAGPDDADEAEL